LSGDAVSVEEVGCAVELVEDSTEVLDGGGGILVEGEGFRGGAPVELVEEALRGEFLPDGLGLLDGGHWWRRWSKVRSGFDRCQSTAI
jgi:hypothetical protein